MERNESKITEDRLIEIAKMLGIDTEDIKRFDEKMIFKNCNNIVNSVNSENSNQYNNNFEQERVAYRQTIEILKLQNQQQQELISQLMQQLKDK